MFPYSVAASFRYAFGRGTGRIMLHSITCNGSPSRLVDCSYSLVQGYSSGGCSVRHDDASIRCYGVLRTCMYLCQHYHIMSTMQTKSSAYLVCCGSFQFHPPALLVPSLSWMGGVGWRGGWRCAEVGCGERFMDGTSMVHKSHANN